MIFPSSILSIFGKHGGVQDPSDSQLYVPNTILPVLEIPSPLVSAQELSTDATLQRDTFQRDGSYTVANAGIIDQVFFNLGPGLWDITLICRQLANYTNLGRFAFVYVSVNGTTGACFLFTSAAVTNVVDREVIKFRVSVGNAGGYGVNVQVAANGVGESQRLDVAAICNRMG